MKPMQQFDAIVVGAGPAGSSAALAMARGGLQVALIERGEYPGAKNVSGAALYAPNLLADLLPNFWEEAPVERYLTRRVVTFLGQEAAAALNFRTNHFREPPYNGFTVLRPRFGRWPANQKRRVHYSLTLPSSMISSQPQWRRGYDQRIRRLRVRRCQGEKCAGCDTIACVYV